MKIRWRLFVHTKNKTKARKVIKRFKDRLNENLTVIEIEQYWKQKTHYKVEAETDIGDIDLAQALLATMRLCQKVAHGWHISGPQEYQNGAWDFQTGVNTDSHASISVAGVSCIFCFCRYDPPKD